MYEHPPQFYQDLEALKDLMRTMYAKYHRLFIKKIHRLLLELLDAKWGELTFTEHEVLRHNFPEVYLHCKLNHIDLWHTDNENQDTWDHSI